MFVVSHASSPSSQPSSWNMYKCWMNGCVAAEAASNIGQRMLPNGTTAVILSTAHGWWCQSTAIHKLGRVLYGRPIERWKWLVIIAHIRHLRKTHPHTHTQTGTTISLLSGNDALNNNKSQMVRKCKAEPAACESRDCQRRPVSMFVLTWTRNKRWAVFIHGQSFCASQITHHRPTNNGHYGPMASATVHNIMSIVETRSLCYALTITINMDLFYVVICPCCCPWRHHRHPICVFVEY